MDPHTETDKARSHDRDHNWRVSEDATSREALHKRGNDGGSRKEDDVDLGVAEEPEQMLVQENVPTFGGIEEVRAHQSVEQQQTAGYHHCRHRKYDGDGDHQLLPEHDGHTIERHS